MSDLLAITEPTDLDLLVFFSDLTGFSRDAAKRSSRDVFDRISAYYVFVGSVIEAAGGRVVKFMGDATLGVFSNPEAGVRALFHLKTEGDAWLGENGFPSRHIIKAHYGPCTCGLIGTTSEKRFDVFGATVNGAAMLRSNGLALTPQVFRQLEGETRRLLKKHTPPITYIPIEERH